MSNDLRCGQCGRAYEIGPEQAGETLVCESCGAAITVPFLDETEPGVEILRHPPRTRAFELAEGSDSIERITKHIETFLGPIATVYHELVSDLVHIDIHFVPPSAGRPFHTLVTSGMSDLPMNVPVGAEDFRHAELMICLPESWSLDQETWSDESHYWPIRWLKTLARLPHEYETWLGIGHTVPNGDPPEPFAPDTDLCCALLYYPLLTPDDFDELVIDQDKKIRFYSLIPLYKEEVDFKLRKGLEPILQRFEENEVTELLDIKRKNVCKVKF